MIYNFIKFSGRCKDLSYCNLERTILANSIWETVLFLLKSAHEIMVNNLSITGMYSLYKWSTAHLVKCQHSCNINWKLNMFVKLKFLRKSVEHQRQFSWTDFFSQRLAIIFKIVKNNDFTFNSGYTTCSYRSILL